MEKVHKDVLRKNRVLLTNDLMVDEKLLSYLVQYGVFTDTMVDFVRAERTRLGQAQRLVTDLQRRGQTAFRLFVECLQESGQHHIAEALLRSEIELGGAPCQTPSPTSAVGEPQYVRGQQPVQEEPMETNVKQQYRHPEDEAQRAAERGSFLSLGDPAVHSIPSASLYGRHMGVYEPFDRSHGRINEPTFGVQETQGTFTMPMGQVTSDDLRGQQTGNDRVYRMTSMPRGVALIINNRYFNAIRLKERLGTDVDRDNLRTLLQLLGYDILVKDNQTAQQMRDTLQYFSTRDKLERVDSCIVAILSHGEKDHVYGTDGRLVPVDDIFAMFDGSMCQSLKGKPKLFLIQACRGIQMNLGITQSDGGGGGTMHNEANVLLDDWQQRMNIRENLYTRLTRLPKGADILIGYATVPGEVSWRNSEHGSWYIQAFCEILYTHAHEDDMLSMMTMVNDRVATAFEINKQDSSGNTQNVKQMPQPVYTLRKKWYLYPVTYQPGSLQ